MTTSKPEPFSPGTIIAGRFLVERIIGSGGISMVAAARHLALNRRVALKFLRSESLSDRDAIRRFVREAHASASIQSEHVARVLDADLLDASHAFIVMEYLDGRDLGDVLKQDGPLPIDDAVDFLLQACEAIAEAHARQIIHRDIKPSNLFLTRATDGSRCIKVLDFGLSKVGWSTAAPTSKNRVLGSPYFMSPEQMRASRDADARSDIWSLGAVLFTLIAGIGPFQGEFLMDVCAAVLSGDRINLHEVRRGVSNQLEALIGCCLQPEPEDRYQSVLQLAEALRPFAPNRGVDRVGRIARVVESLEGRAP